MLRTGKKSKQTKAHEISKKTKEKVYERQHGKSLFAPYRPITVEMCCCHYVSRAQGGLGEEWNIFGCFQSPWLNEHDAFDHKMSDSQAKKMTNLTPKEMEIVVENHFNENYSNWSRELCRYNKYKDVKDYGIKRKDYK